MAVEDLGIHCGSSDEWLSDILLGKGWIDRDEMNKEKPRKGVTEEFRISISCIKDSTAASDESKSDISFKNSVVNRRIEAVINTMHEAKKHLSDFYTQPEIDVVSMAPTFERDWARVNSLIGKGYNTQENNDLIVLGAALWILDAIKRNQKMEELEALLPKDEQLLEKVKHPLIWDCSHDLSTIEWILYIIQNRNSDCRGAKPEAARHHIINDDLMAKGKHRQNVPSRLLFEQVLALIPQKDKENAAHMFKEKSWEWMRNYYEAKHILWEQQLSIVDRAQKAICYAGNTIIEKEPPQENISGIPFASNRLIPASPEVLLREDLAMEKMIAQYERRMDRLQAEFNAFVDKEDFLLDCVYMDTYMPYEYKKQHLGEKIASILDRLTIEDPYALCFAFLYAFDIDSDMPWLYGLGIGFMEQVKKHLPWYHIVKVCESEQIIKMREQLKDEKLRCEQRGELLTTPDKTKAIDFYSLDYGNNNLDKTKRLQCNLAQLIFVETGCCVPRNQHICANSVERLREFGVEENLIGRMGDYITVYSNASEQAHQDRERVRHANEVVTTQQKQIEDLQKQIASLERDLEKQKQENADINQSLHEMTCKARNADEELLELGKKAKQDRMELAELRSIVFAEGEETQEDDSVNIQFPYTIKNRTVVFGGRASAMTAMKTMLKGEIRFMDHRLLPNADMVKNASSVWIQAKCIAHKNCFRIVDLARANGIPIHYFAYTSAAKCAEQVALEDQKK